MPTGRVKFFDEAKGFGFIAGVVWQYAYWLPLVALPLMIVCVITLVIHSATGRARRH